MPAPKEDDPTWPYPSFDARDWAKAFVKAGKEYGWLDKIDEEVMFTWFANALMRGLDEGRAEQRLMPVYGTKPSEPGEIG